MVPLPEKLFLVKLGLKLVYTQEISEESHFFPELYITRCIKYTKVAENGIFFFLLPSSQQPNTAPATFSAMLFVCYPLAL